MTDTPTMRRGATRCTRCSKVTADPCEEETTSGLCLGCLNGGPPRRPAAMRAEPGPTFTPPRRGW